jgi:hypothetical protein
LPSLALAVAAVKPPAARACEAVRVTRADMSPKDLRAVREEVCFNVFRPLK